MKQIDFPKGTTFGIKYSWVDLDNSKSNNKPEIKESFWPSITEAKKDYHNLIRNPNFIEPIAISNNNGFWVDWNKGK